MIKTHLYTWRFFLKIVFVLFFVTSSNCMAQRSFAKKSRKELETKNKTELQQLAIELVKEKFPDIKFNPNKFKSSVWKSSNTVLVKLERIVHFIPLETSIKKEPEYDVRVNLTTNYVYPYDDFLKNEFYIENEQEEIALKFINKNFGTLSPEFQNTIYETEQEYHLYCTNQHFYRKHIFNKKTGQKTSSITTCDVKQHSVFPKKKETLVEMK